jgi:hypothetical protein
VILVESSVCLRVFGNGVDRLASPGDPERLTGKYHTWAFRSGTNPTNMNAESQQY